MQFPAFFLAAIVAGRNQLQARSTKLVGKRPDTIWLPEAETLFDSHFALDLEKIKELEVKHEFQVPLEVSRYYKDYWILHNEDYICIYNKKQNQPYMVTGKGIRWNSYDRVLRSKVVDPRSSSKNTGIQVK